jgi:chemotaxis protein histidine kinase CheA
MTDTRDRPQKEQELHTPEELAAAIKNKLETPEELAAAIKNKLDQICRDLGEHHIGGTRYPPAPAFHRLDRIDIRANRYLEVPKDDTGPKNSKPKRGSDLSDSDGLLKSQLKNWCENYTGDGGRVQVLAVLWEVTYTLLQQTMAYHTLEVVMRATRDFVTEAFRPSELAAGEVEKPEEPEETAMRAVCDAMELIVNDGKLFKWINMSDAKRLIAEARDASATARKIAKNFKPLLPERVAAQDRGSGVADPKIHSFAHIQRFAVIPEWASQLSKFYDAGELAARAVVEFETWLELAPKMYATADPAAGDGPGQAKPDEEAAKKVNDAVAVALEKINAIKPDLHPLIRELCDPWEQVLIEIGGITASPDARVFVPNRAKLRYCYPFAVNLQEDLPPWRYVEQKGETKKDKNKDKQKKLPHDRVTETKDQGKAAQKQREQEKKQEEQERKDQEKYDKEKQEKDKKAKKKRDDFLRVLKEALNKMNVTTGEALDLGASQFFYREDNVYGGMKVPLVGGITIHHLHLPVLGVDGKRLPEVRVDGKRLPEVRKVNCEVWLELSNMGNHCLCIETPLLGEPRPHELYRAVRAGTPFVYGETVVLNEPKCPEQAPARTDQPATDSGDSGDIPRNAAWDTLHAFSRDVVVAVGAALLGFRENTDSFRMDFEPGNLQEIVIAQTDQRPKAQPQHSKSASGEEPTTPPPEAQPEKISAALDNAVGGKILLRTTHQAAAAMAEWVRYPRLSQGDLESIEEAPVLGTAGDWFTNTGEMTVFGFVAAPQWHTDVYAEAAQFAVSWSPLLRLWGRLLQDKIQRSQLGSESEADDPEERDSLRRIEKRVRLHLMQIKAEDLCATRALRLFLDQLLAMAQLDRTQKELEAQLVATEHLTDWYDANARQGSEKNRNILLAVLTLLGIFGLSGFLGDLNKEAGEKILGLIPMKAHGMWEDNVLFGLFLIALFLALYLDLLFWNIGAPRKLKKFFSRLFGRDGTVREFFRMVWRKMQQTFATQGKVNTDDPTGDEGAQ